MQIAHTFFHTHLSLKMSFLSLWKDFLLVRLKPTLYFFHILCCRECFRTYTAFQKHLAYGTIVINMLALYSDLPPKVFLLNIYRGHLCGKIFCLDSDCGKKISKWSLVRSAHTTLHHGGIKTKQRPVTFCPYYGKAF